MRVGDRRLVALIGASGSGKTVIAERAATATGWDAYDTDAVILERTRVDRISEIFDEHGEAYFRELERRCVDELGNLGPHVIVATGGGLPAIPGMMDRLNRLGVTVYLRASLDTLWKRLTTDPLQLENRPLLKTGGREALGRLLNEREPIYRRSSLIVDTEKLSVDEVTALLVTQVRSIDPGATGGSRFRRYLGR